MQFSKLEKYLILLIAISAVIRGFIAGFIEFGNDEVYYWTYALYPDWSHFDHPPMLGWVIQFFTLDLLLDSEFFIRLGSVVFGSINTFLLFLIGKKIHNERAGFIASLLYTSSIYCFVIAGIFILPDTPQSLFWMLSIYFLINVVSVDNAFSKQKNFLLMAAIVLGLGMLSKYTSVFIWMGFGLYVLIYDRKWFKSWQLYVSVLISLVLIFPILYWNIQNEFISFTFHGERIDVSGSALRLDYFFRELFGQIVYNNPITFVLTFIALIAFFKKKIKIKNEYARFLLLTSFPLIILFLGFSLFRATLPHWTSPAYMTLLIFPAIYLAEKFTLKLIAWPLKIALGLLFIILFLGVLQINYGLFSLDDSKNEISKGKHDFSLDMYGWRQIAEQVEHQFITDKENAIVDDAIVLLSHKWFPAAHLDYYVARPLGMKLLTIGSLDQIHKYAWINEERGGFSLGMDAYYITTSHYYKNPDYLIDYFSEIKMHSKFPIYRSGKIVEFVTVYLLKDLKKIPQSQI